MSGAKKLFTNVATILAILVGLFQAWQFFSTSTAELIADVYAYPYLSYENKLVEEYLKELEKGYRNVVRPDIEKEKFDEYEKARDEKDRSFKYANEKLRILQFGEYVHGVVELKIQNKGKEIASQVEIVVENAVFYDFSNNKNKEVKRVMGSVLKIPEIRQGDQFRVISWTSSDHSQFFREGSPDIRINFPSGTADLIYHHDVGSFFRMLDRNIIFIVSIALGVAIAIPGVLGVYVDFAERRKMKSANSDSTPTDDA